MSSYIRQDIENEGTKPKQGTWFGVFAENVLDFTDLARVILPDFDNNLAWGGCRWQARDATSLPQKGDECVVVFDNRNQLWVISWWPF